ncbi:MAG: hypothetical protein LBI71_00130 [Enterobacteriaceae bacterium]|jgi:hypothetical protein|nr:hypothetical protein [Enterobacteriaceae bacterium]
MSTINKLDNKNLLSSSNQYILNTNKIVAPEGTFPWAMIQLYMDTQPQVRRSGWKPNVYVSPNYDDSGSFLNFQRIKQDGSASPWKPEQQEMIACDWAFYNMASFSIKIVESGIEWGYFGAAGALTEFKSNFGVEKIDYFSASAIGFKNTITLGLKYEQDNFQKMKDILHKKNLNIIVNDTVYSLGVTSAPLSDIECTSTIIYYSNNNADAYKLRLLLKENENKTLHFDLSWD